MMPFTRRSIIAAAAILASGRAFAGSDAPKMIVYKDPNCGCCAKWVDHLEAKGFMVAVKLESGMNRIKAKLGVPQALASCHTGIIDAYIIEGHVPAEAIAKLLAEKPAILGLAVPGMPIGSPGMEMAGEAPEPFQVMAFGPDGDSRVFMDFPKGYRA